MNIQSSDTSSTLTFNQIDGEYLLVSLASPACSASKKVWGSSHFDLLANLFSDFAENWKGWQGAKEWSSIESDFSISATTDSMGHINLSIKLNDFIVAEPWSIEFQINLESGMLESIASQVCDFFK